MREFICDDPGGELEAAKARGENILLEGAQGAMLDIEQGAYPYVTSAGCLAAAHAAGLGADLSPMVLGITKSYATRVGAGPFPSELHDETGKKLAEAGFEFGSTTGRPRRCGWLDIPALRRALRLNGCRELAVTKLDVLDGMDQIKNMRRLRAGRRADFRNSGGFVGVCPMPDGLRNPARLARRIRGGGAKRFRPAGKRAGLSGANCGVDRREHRDDFRRGGAGGHYFLPSDFPPMTFRGRHVVRTRC